MRLKSETMTKGTVRVSLDFECGWGMAQGGGWRPKEEAGVYTGLRPAFDRFVSRIDELEFSFLWAVVGAMIDEPSQINLDHLQGSFAQDAKIFLSEAKGPTKDGRDLMDSLMSMKTKQTFGSHTYSHLLASDTDQDYKAYGNDIAQSVRVNKSWGVDAQKLVFPRNIVGHSQVLSDLGFTHIRMPPKNAALGSRSLTKRTLDYLNRPVSPVSEEQDDSGLNLHYASEFLNWGHQSPSFKKRLHSRRVRAALKHAENGGDVHFWLHPFNLAETVGLSDVVDGFLLDLKRLEDRDKITVSGF